MLFNWYVSVTRSTKGGLTSPELADIEKGIKLRHHRGPPVLKVGIFQCHRNDPLLRKG